MKINFKSKKDANLFNSADNMNAKWGINVARKIRQRLMELKAADNLSMINHLPPQRLHMLTNNRQNQYAVDINGSLRLVLPMSRYPF